MIQIDIVFNNIVINDIDINDIDINDNDSDSHTSTKHNTHWSEKKTQQDHDKVRPSYIVSCSSTLAV